MHAWIRFHLEPGLGLAKKHQILALFSHPQDVYLATPDRLHARIPAAIARQLLSPPTVDHAKRIEETLNWASQKDHHLLTMDHQDYPSLLKEMPDAPLLLFARGDLKRLMPDAIAIVGSRNATIDGLENAKAFASYLSNQGLCVLSGLAYGIDAAAHEAALTGQPQAGGTIAVLGTGIDIIYPSAHTRLASDILEKNGLLLSEFPLSAPPLPAHFPRRNRIVAGLSRGVLVIEAALKSGSLITARLANEMGREIFAVPGSIHSPLSRGPHALIQQGARLIETGEDVLSELGYLKQAAMPKSLKAANPAPTPPASPLWQAIGYDPVTEEALAMRVNMLPGLMQTELLSLELDGYIIRHPGGIIQRARTGKHIVEF